MIDDSQFTDADIESKLCSMPENEMSTSILIPLFEKIYSGSAQFTGGNQERGKDILITTKDEFGDKKYVAIQAKKLKLTGNTQRPGNLQQLLNQLAQASSEPVIDQTSGARIIVDQVIFVTPYTISQSALNSHETAYRRIIEEHKCKILDGAKLVILIRRHRPSWR